MPILPQNTDPLKDYVQSGQTPPLSTDGLVYNGVYGHTGVIDSLAQAGRTGYTDPNLNVVNGNNKGITFSPQLSQNWISSTDFGGENSTPVILTYELSSTTYYNNITFDVLNVPCFVELGYYTQDPQYGNYTVRNSLPGVSTFVIAGGSDIYTTTNWLRQEYQAPETLSGVNNLAIRITRNKSVQTNNSVTGPTLIAYSVGVRNFSIKLQVMQETDVPAAVISGTDSITTQNRFNFAEKYSFYSDSVANAFSNSDSGLYWKSAPQPVKDSIVYFYAQVNNTQPTSINRLYIDPLYTGCNFNLYYTTDTGTDPSQFYWTPVQRDFVLRKGTYELPTLICTYLKFEFTSLVAEVYDLPFDSVPRVINAFPTDVEDYYTNIENNIINSNSVQYSFFASSNLPPSNVSLNVLSNSTVFGYASNTVSNSNNWPSLSALNASQTGNASVGLNALASIVDPSSSYKTINVDGNYNNQTDMSFLQRRFPDTRQHVYTQINIDQNWHQAYFTGVQYVTAFMEKNYDDLRTLPGSFISSNGTTSGFPTFPVYSGSNPVNAAIDYVGLNSDDVALTPWMSTIDTFKSFNIGALTTDWKSFITDNQVLLNDTSNLVQINSTAVQTSKLGTSTIVAVNANASGSSYGVKTGTYNTSTNLINYYDSNFIPASGTALSWSGLGGTTVTGTTVTGIINGSLVGTYSGMSVSGGNYAVAYNFTLPNVYSTGGAQAWKLQLGAPALGTVGYAEYIPTTSGSYGSLNYYFLVNAQTSGNSSGTPTATTTLTSYTQFVNPDNGYAAIAGTVATGTVTTITSGIGSNLATLTGTNSTVSGIPSNTIQLVVSGTSGKPFNLYQLGAYTAPTSSWIGPQDRKNMRVSGVARILLPYTNNGIYRASLYANDFSGNLVELAHKVYLPNTIPINTWVDIEVQSFSGINYTNFSMQIQQTNPSSNEVFYVGMLSPFYHPVRYEYITTSGASNWQPITTGINDPTSYIATVSGIPASGIQVKMTALDSNVYINGISVIPQYKQSPYYANLEIDYAGNSKTNEQSSRRSIANKPYFLLNKYPYPIRFQLSNVAGTVAEYIID